MIPTSTFIFLFIEILAVTYLDLKVRKIPNSFAILNLIFFTYLILYQKAFYSFAWEHFAYSIIFLIIGFFLFTLKVMGGGDSKFLASFFLTIPTNYQDFFLLNLLWTTIIVSGILFLINIIENFVRIIKHIRAREFSNIKNYFGKKIPFAPVILMAWIWLGLEKIELLLPF